MTFELKHRDDLNTDDFENHNIWVQYYSADEIDHIEKEGYDRTDVLQKLEEVNWSDEYWFKSYPTQEKTPYMFTRYKAEFELPNQKTIKGYIEYTEYSGIQNYGLYAKGEFIGLNAQHSDLNEEEEIELKTKLNLTELYPMFVRCSNGLVVNEVFEPEKSS